MTKTRDGGVTSWFRTYFWATLNSWDARLALVAGGLVFAHLLRSAPARVAALGTLSVTVGVCAGILGIVLAAMAVVTAFITRGFVAIIQDLEEALEPFAMVARVAAVGIIMGLATMLSAGSPAPWLSSLMSATSVTATVWATVGVVQLVRHTIFFATVRGTEIQTLIDAEGIRARRLQESRKVGNG